LQGGFGFSTAELNRILETLAAHLAALCDGWELIHGNH
jgi:hypothetical protein